MSISALVFVGTWRDSTDKGTLRRRTLKITEYNGDLAEAYRQPLRDSGLPVDEGAVQLFLKEHGLRPPSPRVFNGINRGLRIPRGFFLLHHAEDADPHSSGQP